VATPRGVGKGKMNHLTRDSQQNKRFTTLAVNNPKKRASGGLRMFTDFLAEEEKCNVGKPRGWGRSCSAPARGRDQRHRTKGDSADAQLGKFEAVTGVPALTKEKKSIVKEGRRTRLTVVFPGSSCTIYIMISNQGPQQIGDCKRNWGDGGKRKVQFSLLRKGELGESKA